MLLCHVISTLVGEVEARLVVTGERRVMAGCRGEASTTAVARASLLLLACTYLGVRVWVPR